jgi:hypothetical protein
MIPSWFLRLVSTGVLLLTTSQASINGQIAPSPKANVILEVVNRHFTVGKKIPSLFLRLFSDGTVECSTVRFSEHDSSTTREGRLTTEELADATAIINDPALLEANGRYELHRWVFDSWMEWDVRIENPKYSHDVTVSFAGAGERAYPASLAKLGCVILKARQEVFGDNTKYYYPACNEAFPPHSSPQH